MPRWGMVIDLDKCAGCQACTVACRAENNVPFAGPEEASRGRAIFWNELIPVVEGEFPHLSSRTIPRPCMHCDRPPCVRVCPVGATYRNPEGTIGQIYARCIGCRLCMCACPYSARSFNWYAPSWPPSLERQLNPNVSTRPKGVVEKCLFCVQRLNQAKEKAWKEGGPLRDEDLVKQPACCQTCPADARTGSGGGRGGGRVWGWPGGGPHNLCVVGVAPRPRHPRWRSLRKNVGTGLAPVRRRP